MKGVLCRDTEIVCLLLFGLFSFQRRWVHPGPPLYWMNGNLDMNGLEIIFIPLREVASYIRYKYVR